MKVLVGAACLAVLAFVGYYFWGEYQKYEHQQFLLAQGAKQVAQERARQAAIDWLYDFAELQPGDEDGARTTCENLKLLVSGKLSDNSVARDLEHNCRALGYIQ